MVSAFLLAVHIGAGALALLTAVVASVTAKGGTLPHPGGKDLRDSDDGDISHRVAVGGTGFQHLPAAHRRVQHLPGLRGMALCQESAGAASFRGLVGRRGHGSYRVGHVGVCSGPWSTGNASWVTMLVFGAIAAALSLVDGRYYWGLSRGNARAGAKRIQRHLTNMLAGTIATVTAVLVVNVQMDPVWLPWILPTLIITPLIVWWNLRVRRGASRRPGGTG